MEKNRRKERKRKEEERESGRTNGKEGESRREIEIIKGKYRKVTEENE